MLGTGLVKPLVELGDSGAPRVEDDGDLERRSEVRRNDGAAELYKSRILMGECGCGSPDVRDGGPNTGEFL
jgi:hypothetical protein